VALEGPRAKLSWLLTLGGLPRPLRSQRPSTKGAGLVSVTRRASHLARPLMGQLLAGPLGASWARPEWRSCPRECSQEKASLHTSPTRPERRPAAPHQDRSLAMLLPCIRPLWPSGVLRGLHCHLGVPVFTTPGGPRGQAHTAASGPAS